MVNRHDDFKQVSDKMRQAGLSELAIDQFHYYYNELKSGTTGLISGSDISSVAQLPDAAADKIANNEDFHKKGAQALDHTCVIKLNGGLGTGMGLDRAKSLLEVTDGLSFLDIIIKQCLHLRKHYSCSVPLMFMNSFRTEADTLDVIGRYSEFDSGQDGLPSSFLQNKVPRLLKDSLLPAQWPQDENLEWCPPGHGDIYTALFEAGVLKQLKEKGYRYLFISNADNLGATLTLEILGYFASNNLPFMMEVADRTAVDKKGGHLACSSDGSLLLRESAQCPKDELEEFQDISKYRYFNTNSLWLDIEALSDKISSDVFLKLPLIVNEKQLHPEQSDSPQVLQLETAMGAALSLFAGASAIRVPRSRFAPVKKTTDLLTLRSDYFTVSDTFHVTKNQKASADVPVVELDAKYFSTIGDFEKRFPFGAPSLLQCSSLKIRGDVVFGKNVRVIGDVEIQNSSTTALEIADDSELTSSTRL